ncbi:D-alanyl-D-alanine carboxypeptidase family protein [Corynebacterium minutissimum]|uniref:D-alanyl-D-alanine carboxypeptidase n=1 Tax=Corynebacterium minutissimum TaxID=38301 RepID=A0A2X4URH5_9CORY|nr:serine hydrolase [Corynebacterium minutissimum]KHO29974.1 D-alanyl-D-alanine carboxypeptidase [Corynebacterium minutissimum]QPS60454.1 D-alanyl-D-alanine carboxypeptidase [Corynebacterium minutissimum]QQA78757.1 D-alanyl-D-alanine carboxypeptidase [Corynebacterium minutissimum]SQI00694.1 D-alanyl-D-alanine carboxypeptidase [Corynebacterium minutissimum]VEG05238.1 D-alanyl-D-alanine carboxypeptidase [Corynebacterium minutissimum]
MKYVSALIATLTLLITPPAYAEESDETSSSLPTRTTAPDTDSCPHSLVPAEPSTTSEELAPGQATPTPLPPVDGAACGVTAPRGFKVNKDVVASAWMVSDLDSGEIIAMKDPNGRYRPASIIKALLALVVIEELPLDQRITATLEDASVEGSAVGIGPEGTYTVEQLLQGLLMASGNDAAHALATALGGDEDTLRKVNEKAREIGTRSTVAASYSGLDAAGMSTSAADISLIYREAFANDTFARIVDTEHVDFPGWGEMPGYELWNDNGLYLNDPDGIGGKTGYTEDAHHTFVGAIDRDGRRLQAVILDTTVDHGFRAWEQAQMLLDESSTVTPGHGVGQLEDFSAQAAEETTVVLTPTPPTPTKTPETTQPRSSSSFEDSQGWIGWMVAGLVALLVVVVATFSLLRR